MPTHAHQSLWEANDENPGITENAHLSEVYHSVSFRFHRMAHTQWSAHEGKPADCILSGTVASKARLRALNLTQIRV